MECSICLESLIEEAGSPISENNATTLCGHIFHYNCLFGWLPTNPSCPRCRKPVSPAQLRKVYLELDANGGGARRECQECPILQATVESLRDQNRDYLRSANSFEGKFTQAKDKINDLKNELKEIREEKKKLIMEFEKLKTDRDSSRKKDKEEMKRLSSEVDALREQKKELETVIEKLTKARQEDKTDKEEIKRLSCEVVNLREKVKDLDKKLADCHLYYVNLLRMKHAQPGESVTKLKSLRMSDQDGSFRPKPTNASSKSKDAIPGESVTKLRRRRTSDMDKTYRPSDDSSETESECSLVILEEIPGPSKRSKPMPKPSESNQTNLKPKPTRARGSQAGGKE